MSDYPMLISNKLHSFRNFRAQKYKIASIYYYFCESFYKKDKKIVEIAL